MKPESFLVAVDAPLLQPLSYLPKMESNTEEPKKGQSVKVPLGKRTVNGVILGSGEAPTEFELKSIKEIDVQRPAIPTKTLEWLKWISNYYLYPIGQTVSLAFPPLKKSEKKRKSKKAPVVPQIEYTEPPSLTEEQKKTVDAIKNHHSFSVHLVHGVTGSGKTEIYLQLLDQCLKKNKVGIVLVPEISLTPQLIERFSARFQDQIAVIHSHLTEREKTDQWWSMIDGQKKILIGARSALFCPVEDIGLIVIDEEHEGSFKQDEKLKYHARDAAIMLSKHHDCPIVLGSATPSLESWQNVIDKKFHYHELKNRVSNRQLPNVQVVDLKDEREKQKQIAEEGHDPLPFWMSQLLYEKLQETFEKGEQAALFLNRRGIAQVVNCKDCGSTEECPNCEISLTLHGNNHLVCHYCDYSKAKTEHCPECDSADFGPLGLGTELIEKDLLKMFPKLRLGRADRDEINSREDLEQLIKDVENNKIDVLIGTQMIAKGLDFKNLTLVGLVLADVGFNLPDFRSSERSFHLLTQVSGRAGRHSDEPGQVIIQTYNPEHPSITHTETHTFKQFAVKELENRQALNYPPFGRIACIKIQGNQYEKALKTAQMCAHRGLKLRDFNPKYLDVQILGPAPAPLAKLRGKYRFQILLKSPSSQVMGAFSQQFLGDQKWVPNGTKVQIDVDPVNML